VSQVKIQGNASGTGVFTVTSPNSNTDRTLTLPDASGAFNISGAVNEVPAGSASAPSIYPTGDTNTGMFFPAADTIAFATAGTEDMRIDSSGNVGIGTSSPSARLEVFDTSAAAATSLVQLTGQNNFELNIQSVTTTNSTVGARYNFAINSSNGEFSWSNSGGERARIDSSGNLLVGTTTAPSTAGGSGFIASSLNRWILALGSNSTGGANVAQFYNPNGQVGSISTSGSSTAYNTSSDYRLKNTIAPMAGALAKVALLKPCTYKWNVDGSDGQGFIAHELAEVEPGCVTGEKDAVNEDGSIKPQGIDTSFLVATLTAAIQEQQALITSLTARIAALEGQ
jgi:hypothetical protein